MKKLAIIITHPIQYYVPLFKQLAQSCDLKVFYTWGEKGAEAKYDPDFKQIIAWDLPLLDGYHFEFLNNTAKDPGSHHFRGIINPDLIVKINSFTPDAILVYGWAYQSHLKALRYFKGKIPLWFRGDSTLLDEQKGLKQVLRSLFLKWVYQHINKAFYVGKANKAYFKKFGLKEHQLIFAPHSVDNDRFAEAKTEEVKLLRKQLNIKENEILILFAGKLESKKNPELLLNAFATLNQQRNKIHLLFVGNGELEEKLKQVKVLPQAQDDKLVNIHFMDFQNQSQMPAVYQACDLFCLPSQSETWGLAINEAMACAKPILASNKVGCANDLVENGKNGYIFESENLDDLKLKLSLVLNPTTDLKEMSNASKNKIQNWTINKQAEAILKALNT